MTEQVVTVTAVEPGRVELVPTDRPAAGPGQVAGTTLVSLLSPGTELSMAYPVELRYALPLPLGYAAVFVVEDVGPNVIGVDAGDVVMSMGPHASWQCLNADEVIPLPPGLLPEVAVFSRIMNVPMTALATSRARPGNRVGVIGLGLIGQMTARVFAAAGFETVAADSSEERRDLLPAGIARQPAIDPTSVDLVIECSGREELMLAGAQALRPGGELILTGVPWRRRADTHLFEMVDVVFHQFLTMRSGWEWQVPINSTSPGSGPDIVTLFTRSMQWLRDGEVQIEGLAGLIGPEGVEPAYQAIRARTAERLTQVVRWSENPEVRH